MKTVLSYKVDFINQSEVLHPFIDAQPFNGLPADYLGDYLSEDLLSIINFLKTYSKLKGKEALVHLSNWTFKEPNNTEIKPFLLDYEPVFGFCIRIKNCHDYDNLQIVYDLLSNELVFFDGLLADFEDKISKKNPMRKVNLEQWLYLWDWWQAKKAAGLQIETGEIEIPIAASLKYSIYQPLYEYLKEDIDRWLFQRGYWEHENLDKDWYSYLKKIENKLKPFSAPIAILRDLSTRRPLLAREKIELDFLEKIQAANSSKALQNLENELNNTATDPQVKTQLQKYITEKKAFY